MAAQGDRPTRGAERSVRNLPEPIHDPDHCEGVHSAVVEEIPSGGLDFFAFQLALIHVAEEEGGGLALSDLGKP
jgi:hypothetical protein